MFRTTVTVLSLRRQKLQDKVNECHLLELRLHSDGLLSSWLACTEHHSGRRGRPSPVSDDLGLVKVRRWYLKRSLAPNPSLTQLHIFHLPSAPLATNSPLRAEFAPRMKLTAATSGGKKKKGSDKGLNSAHILKRLHSHTHPLLASFPSLVLYLILEMMK